MLSYYTRYLICLICLFAQTDRAVLAQNTEFRTGAEQTELYWPELQGKRVGIVINHNAMLGSRLLPDTLIADGIHPVRAFGPERGFRGTGILHDGKDPITGLPFVRLYGNRYKPVPDELMDIDLMLIDIQDLGVRFYIYLATLHYMMEACAEQGIPVLLLDRPNPQGAGVDGPVTDPAHHSPMAMHPIPILHGMTIGELATMINEERWLAGGAQCSLQIISMTGYDRKHEYVLSFPPFPNLKTPMALRLYPSLCWFDGTVISQGRGTPDPFTVLGHPDLGTRYDFAFTPVADTRGGDSPLYAGQICYGKDVSGSAHRFLEAKTHKLRLDWLLEFYLNFPAPDSFFQSEKFDRLAGTSDLRGQVRNGWSETRIRQSWAPALSSYRLMRSRYLMYPD